MRKFKTTVCNMEVLFVFVFVLYCSYLSSIHEKANCIVYFGWDFRTCLGVAICDGSGSPVFHIKTGASR